MHSGSGYCLVQLCTHTFHFHKFCINIRQGSSETEQIIFDFTQPSNSVFGILRWSDWYLGGCWHLEHKQTGPFYVCWCLVNTTMSYVEEIGHVRVIFHLQKLAWEAYLRMAHVFMMAMIKH